MRTEGSDICLEGETGRSGAEDRLREGIALRTECIRTLKSDLSVRDGRENHAIARGRTVTSRFTDKKEFCWPAILSVMNPQQKQMLQ
jgi:hypothetical protein